MISWLSAFKKPWIWLLFHILLGYLSTISSVFLVVYFYLFAVTSLFVILFGEGKRHLLTLLIVYLIPFEIVCRMAQTSPAIPYELSKYLQFILLLFGIFTGRGKGALGLLMFLLLLPGLFFDSSGSVNFKDLVFNVLAPINLCLGIIYFYKVRTNKESFERIIIAILLPLISALIFTYLKTPDYEEIEFVLGSNFETTGGFGSNQVSTVFGLGMFLTFYLWYNRIALSGFRFIDGLVLFLFVLQGLLSFSRGGMIGGALAILIILFFDIIQKKSHKLKTVKSTNYLIPALFLVLSAIWLTNNITDGNLLLRYQGETAGTLAGTREKDLNSITTNRVSIFEGDWNLFLENNFGVGAGASKYLRVNENGVLSHIELSRLAAEHGYLGLIFFSIYTLIPFYYFNRRNKGQNKSVAIAIYVLAWYTTFHAATRNFVTPLLAGVALISVVDKVGRRKVEMKNEVI